MGIQMSLKDTSVTENTDETGTTYTFKVGRKTFSVKNAAIMEKPVCLIGLKGGRTCYLPDDPDLFSLNSHLSLVDATRLCTYIVEQKAKAYEAGILKGAAEARAKILDALGV
jgi:hypothetical protein